MPVRPPLRRYRERRSGFGRFEIRGGSKQLAGPLPGEETRELKKRRKVP
jgi:hypothetical protein